MVRPAYTAVIRDRVTQTDKSHVQQTRHTRCGLAGRALVWRGRVVTSYNGIRTSSSSTGMEGTCISTFEAAAAEVSVG